MLLGNILIVGLKQIDAGKTTLACALISFLREEGVDACGFKPMAGNNLWYDYDIVYKSMREGRIYGQDAVLLKKASETKLTEEVINPVHRLWAEPPHRVKKIVLELPFFVLDRVSVFTEKPQNVFVVNKTLPFRYGIEESVENLCSESKVFYVSSVSKLNRLMKTYYDEAVESAHKVLMGRYESIIYESYQDVAMPWSGVEDLELVLGVEPGHIYAYNPNKFQTAIKLSTNLWKEVRMSKILNLLKPIESLKTDPERKAESVEKLKKKLTFLIKRHL